MCGYWCLLTRLGVEEMGGHCFKGTSRFFGVINMRKQPFWVAETVTRDPADFLWRWWGIGRTQKYLKMWRCWDLFSYAPRWVRLYRILCWVTGKGSSHLFEDSSMTKPSWVSVFRVQYRQFLLLGAVWAMHILCYLCSYQKGIIISSSPALHVCPTFNFSLIFTFFSSCY